MYIVSADANCAQIYMCPPEPIQYGCHGRTMPNDVTAVLYTSPPHTAISIKCAYMKCNRHMYNILWEFYEACEPPQLFHSKTFEQLVSGVFLVVVTDSISRLMWLMWLVGATPVLYVEVCLSCITPVLHLCLADTCMHVQTMEYI